MGKIWFIMKEMFQLVRTHKLYVISPILITLALRENVSIDWLLLGKGRMRRR